MTTDLLSVPAGRRTAIEEFARSFTPGRRVALSTHLNADGDGCGSESALARLLSSRGLLPHVVNPTPWPEMFDFLLEGVDDRTSQGSKALRDVDLLIVLDISDVKRLGHLTDTAVVLGWEITPAIARALYTGMVTDTGGYRFSNTSPRCLAIAAQLLAAGVDPEDMYTRIYASAPAGRIRLMADVLGTLQVDEHRGLTWLSMHADALEKYQVKAEDLDGLVEHARSIAGTRMALLFRDLGNGKVKVSFRSTGATDVNVFAREFGGGGHARASGALISGELADVRDKVVERAKAFLAAPG